MKLSPFYLVTLLGIATAVRTRFSYDGYKVYGVTINSVEEAKLLDVFRYDDRFDFWSRHRIVGKPIDIMVSPKDQDEFETRLNYHNIRFEVRINNVEEQMRVADHRVRTRDGVALGNVTEFLRHKEINAYLRRLETDYPDIVTTEVIGQSFEDREMLVIKISSGGSDNPTIFIDTGIHAREWTSPSTALYMINQLVKVPDNSYLYKNVDWVFLPVANPDGYEFTHIVERMWKKTRSVGLECYGVDANRNFGFHWGESGSSDSECSEIYRGSKAFSEVETRAIRDYLSDHSQQIRLYVSVHTYGRMITYPWSYADLLPDNADELETVALLFNEAVYAFNGNNYTVGNAAKLEGATAGCSDDFAKGVLNITLEYTVDIAGEAFDPPESDILWVGEEAWEGFKAWHGYVESSYAKSPQ